MSWKNRCEWVDENLDNINFKNGELIKKAEKKIIVYCFLFWINQIFRLFK